MRHSLAVFGSICTKSCTWPPNDFCKAQPCRYWIDMYQIMNVISKSLLWGVASPFFDWFVPNDECELQMTVVYLFPTLKSDLARALEGFTFLYLLVFPNSDQNSLKLSLLQIGFLDLAQIWHEPSKKYLSTFVFSTFSQILPNCTKFCQILVF